jgi:LysM repeat protein
MERNSSTPTLAQSAQMPAQSARMPTHFAPLSAPSAQTPAQPTQTIHIYPWQRLEDQPIAALLGLIPRLCATYQVRQPRGTLPIATARSYYQLRFSTGARLRASDNLIDILRLIDGQRTIQAISDSLAEQQGRPVHPAEIAYLLRSRLIPAGLAELIAPALPALPAPSQHESPALTSQISDLSTPGQPPAAWRDLPGAVASPDMAPVRQPARTRPLPQQATHPASIQWIPEASRTSRLRKRRRPSALRAHTHRASLVSLLATLLVVLAAGAAFNYGQASFTHASFSPPSLSSIFGPVGPTPPTAHPHAMPTPKQPLLPIRYVVQERDTLDSIAAHFHVTAKALLLVNNLSSAGAIHPDQVLIIPTVYRPGAKVSTLAHPIFYVVQPGDSLYGISQLFGTPIDKITQLNRIADPKLIQPGDGLVIP